MSTTTPREEMEAALEAILFVSSEPVPRERLLELFEEDEQDEARLALAAVLERYTPTDGRGLMVDEVAGGVRIVTRPELAGWLRRFFEVRGSSKLSMAALETLAIVAYRQPITAPEIQELRSVNPSGVLKTLLERHLVRIAGRKQVVGNPFLYRTTKEFLNHFGLNTLKDLPPLEEFEETFGLSGAGGLGVDGGESGELFDEDGNPLGADREEVILQQAVSIDEAEGRAADEAEDEADRAAAAAEEARADAPLPDEGEEPEDREQPDLDDDETATLDDLDDEPDFDDEDELDGEPEEEWVGAAEEEP